MRNSLLAVALVLGLAQTASAKEQKVASAPATTCFCTCSRAAQVGREDSRKAFLKALQEGKLTEPGLIAEEAGQNVRR